MEVAVLGARDPARTLTQLCARAGYDVSLHADDATAVMDVVDDVEAQLPDELVAQDLIEGTTGLGAALSDAALVIETSIEDAGRLQKRFATIEEQTDADTLIATGQPTASITAAAAGLRHPGRALGLQFHRPLTDPLIELVVTAQTTQPVADRARTFASGLDADAIVVTDAPGGATTRLGLALEAEAMRLVDSGVAGVAAVDRALVAGYDHTVGPLEQADRAGLDERLDALDRLAQALGPRFEPPELLSARVDAGATGREAGEGFYHWEDGNPTDPAVSVSPPAGAAPTTDDPGPE